MQLLGCHHVIRQITWRYRAAQPGRLLHSLVIGCPLIWSRKLQPSFGFYLYLVQSLQQRTVLAAIRVHMARAEKV